ncbi:P-loop containing nucleoside triphosphate hydrolase protein [Scenedesmus sp. NREL 46B-D3]|nr:P-loop containing nucleoside triphosphate hydrolase protein [Scenedesmus sp. NREL 46B-D3]
MGAHDSVHHQGTAVWVADTEGAWTKGVVKAFAGDLLVVTTAGGERRVPPAEAPLQNKDDAPVEDMTDLAFLHEPGVLWNLKQRYAGDAIYTYTGGILIAVNPFKGLPALYSTPVMDSYSSGDDAGLAPHVYAVASGAYRKMRQEGKGQAILVRGERATQRSAAAWVAFSFADADSVAQVGARHQLLLLLLLLLLLVACDWRVGAGKTETSKLIMRYLAYLGGFKKSAWDLAAAEAQAAASSSIEQKVLESNPLLEAFGNAKTVRNDNSSRFGKYVQLNFNARGSISGAAVRTYLLERSRLVHLNKGERNYHIFYQVCSSSSSSSSSTSSSSTSSSLAGVMSRGAALVLAEPSSYGFLNQSGVYELAGVDSAAEFAATRHAMSLIGISRQQQEDVFRILSALLHLGNVGWEDAHHSSSTQHSSSRPDGLCNGTAEAAAAAAGAGGCPLAAGPESPAALAAAAKLLGVDVAGLARALGTRTRATPDGPITSPLDARASAANRDALVKVVYARLFDWLVGRINGSIGQDPAAAASIGLLDIYGFESFQFNDLEQFCINLANEKLQQHFNQHVFKWEQAEYEAEGIDWSYIDFVDNQDVLDLIEGKLGLVDLLDEQCRFPTATHKVGARCAWAPVGWVLGDLADKLFAASNVTSSARFERTKRSTGAFTLQHYAGPVSYSLDNFLDKNKDFVVAEHASLLGAAGVELLPELFGAAEPETARPNRAARSLKAFQFVSVCSHFKRQLAELMALLHQLEPHYVRCIKPNPASKPSLLDDAYTLHQLKCGGVMEAVRISCAGYPFRRAFADFLEQFWQLHPAGRRSAASGDAAAAAAACRELLAATGMSEGVDYQVGLTKVFLKAHQSALLNKLYSDPGGLEGAHGTAPVRSQARSPVTIQAGVRGMIGRRRAAAVRRRQAATRLQAAWRCARARTAYLQLQQAALVLQCAARGAAARAVYRHLLEQQRQAAATAIQAAWRGRRVRLRCAAELAGALALQSAWRGLLARQHCAGQLQQHRAAVCIQRQWRRHVQERNGDFRCDAAAEAAALVIQGIWREREQHNSRVRRLQAAVRRYAALHTAAGALQAAWRGRAARRVLSAHQEAQRRCRFKQQMAMFEQRMTPTTTTSFRLRPLPPPPAAAYGVSYAGINGDINPIAPGEHTWAEQPPKPRNFKLFSPPPPAAYGVGYQGRSSGAGQPPPAPAASYGVTFSGLQHLAAGSSSDTAGATNSSSAWPARLLSGLRRLGSGPASKGRGACAGGGEGEESPLLDVVKADDVSLLPPEDRLFVRLGSLVEDQGRVSSAVGSWRDRLRTR